MSRSSQIGDVTERARGRGRLTIASGAAGCLVALLILVAGAVAATSSRTTVVLGGTATTPDPSCPELPCQAVGSVTGFQVSTDQGSLPFRVRRDGVIKITWNGGCPRFDEEGPLTRAAQEAIAAAIKRRP